MQAICEFLAMQAICEFFAMGGQGIYIWPAYGITAVVMIAFLVTTLRRLKVREAALKAMRAARQGVEPE